jgi:hypothetical protein
VRAGRLAAAAAAASLVVAGPTAAQEPADAEDHLVLVRQTPWVPPGGTFALRVRVDDAPDDAELRVALHDRVRTRSAFARSLEGTGLRARLTGSEAVPLEQIDVGDDGAREVRLATGTITGEQPIVTLGADAEGVYPVVVDLLDGDGELLDRLVTHLIRLPDPDPDEHPLGAVVVLPLHAPPSHTAPSEIDVAALAPLDITVDALVAHPGVPLTLVPTPEALAAAVDADPAAAARLAEAVNGREVLAAPWIRLDPVAWDAGGLDAELADQHEAGSSALTTVLGAAPDERVAVVGPGSGVDGVAAAVASGARTVVVPADDLEPLDGDVFPVTLTRPFLVPTEAGDEPGTVTAVVADAALANHPGATDDPVLDAHRLLADLAVLALDAPVSPRVAVAVLDDDTAADPAFLEALLTALAQPPRAGAAPLVRATTVTDAIDEVEPAGAEGGADAEDRLVRSFAEDLGEPVGVTALRDDLRTAAADVASYRSVFGPTDGLATEVSELVLTAGASSLGAGDRRALLDAGIEALRVELRGIHGPPRQRVTLTAREGQVQLVLGNDTARAADVTVQLRGDRLEFPDHPGRRLEVRLAPETTTRVDLDVRARSSGDAPLDLRIISPDGRLELAASRVTVRTTAVSGVGVVLMGAAALFLVVWWTRTILRERGTPRRRRHPAHARG